MALNKETIVDVWADPINQNGYIGRAFLMRKSFETNIKDIGDDNDCQFFKVNFIALKELKEDQSPISNSTLKIKEGTVCDVWLHNDDLPKNLRPDATQERLDLDSIKASKKGKKATG